MASDQAAGPHKTARAFFLTLFAVTTVALVLLVRPLASALFLAAVLAGVSWSLNLWLVAKVRYRWLAAALLVLGVILVLVLPLGALSAFLIREGADAVRLIADVVRSEGVAGLVETLPEPLRKLAHGALERLPRETGAGIDEAVEQQLGEQGGRAAAAAGALVAATGSFLFQLAMMLIAFYAFLLDGEKLLEWIDKSLPLKPGQTRELVAEFKKVSYAVITSTLITSAVQALAALLGYFIARLPNPFFFAALTFFVAFIPAVGAASVCFLGALILAFSGHPYAGLFLAIWGMLVVGLVDNLVKPILIRAGMEMRGAVVFFSLIGGLAAFGAIGLLLGPLVVALFLALLRMYQRDFAPAAAADGQAGESGIGRTPDTAV